MYQIEWKQFFLRTEKKFYILKQKTEYMNISDSKQFKIFF